MLVDPGGRGSRRAAMPTPLDDVPQVVQSLSVRIAVGGDLPRSTATSGEVSAGDASVRHKTVSPVSGASVAWRLLAPAGLLACFCLTFHPHLAMAQRYLVRTYTESDGLPNTTVRDLAQDAEGRMWFLTSGGVTVYDGYEWISPGGGWARLLRGDYDRLALEPTGGAWVATGAQAFALAHYDGQQWTEVNGPRTHSPIGDVTALAVFAVENRPLVAVGTSEAGLYVWTGEHWHHYGTDEGLPSTQVRALAADRDSVFIGTSSGLAVLKDGAIDVRPNALIPPQARGVLSLCLDRAKSANDGIRTTDRPLWIIATSCIGYLQGGRFTIVTQSVPRFTYGAAPEQLVCVTDARGGLFFGCRYCLYHLHPPSRMITRISQDNGLPASGVTGLCTDHEGTLWLAGDRGVSKIVSMEFATYQRDHGLLENEVTAILPLPSGAMVFGHNIGLTYFDGGSVTHVPLTHPGYGAETIRRVLDLDVDRDGDVWAACSQAGLARIDRSGRVRWLEGSREVPNAISSVRVDAGSRVWASGDAGIYRMAAGALELVAPGALPRCSVRRILRGPGDAMYFATYVNGLYCLESGRWRRCQGAEGPDSNSVFATCYDHAGTLWVGTRAGLFVAIGDELRRPDMEAMRVKRPVYFLLEDRRNRLWFGTDFGAYRWDGHQLDHFTVLQGLAGQETNRAAGVLDAAGRVWIGTDGGVSSYREEFARPPGLAPLIQLTNLETSLGAQPLGRPAEVKYKDNTLFLEARAISFVDESRIVYRSKLEGYDQDWVQHVASTHFESRYPRVPPGSYRFLIQARNAEGESSPIVTSAAIVVEGPFWEEGWFYLLCSAFLVGLAYSIQHYASQRRYSRRLEREVGVRTQQLAASREVFVAESQRLSATLASIADGVVVVDREGRVSLINPAAEGMMGCSAAVAMSKPFGEVMILRRADGGDPVDPTDDVLKSEQPLTFFDLLMEGASTGAARSVELTGAPVRSSGRASGVVFAFRDVSERKRVEREILKAQKLEALGILAGGIAHDFNNILTVILGHISLARVSGGMSESALSRLGETEKALKRAHDLAQQLLTFARGGVPVTGPVSIRDLVRESTQFVLSGSKLRCDLRLPDGLWAVEVDPGQVNQVLNNVLINALQAMPAGGTIEVGGQNLTVLDGQVPELPGGRYVRLDITDHGTGIPHDLLPRIFDPYFTTKQKGSGLGLATAYSIMRSHGGTMAVESELGKGTTFRLYLPISSKAPVQSQEIPGATLVGRGRVLVMDDEGAVREVLEGMLAHLGYETSGAAHGAQAIEVYQEARRQGRPFDLVVLDLTIRGGMGGKEALQQLLRIDPGAKIVASSGYSNDPAMSRPEECGFLAVLPKPYRLSDVERVLRGLASR